MEKATQRLNLLFMNNEPLLEKDTGLRLPVSKTKPEVLSTTSQNVAHKKQRLHQGFSTQSSASVAARNLTVAPNEVDESQTRLNHGMDKEDGDESDERIAFESGIEASMSLVARSFCPAAAIVKLPYKYMRGLTAEMIGKRFFDRGQFWAREWDLYYIFPPQDLAPGPLLLLPASQVQQFLDLISKYYNIRLTIPTDPDLGLLLSFEEEGMPKPQYLGRSSDRDVKDDLVSTMSLQPRDLVDSIDQPSGGLVISADIVEAFRQKMKAGLSATKNKSKASREKRRALKIERQREWVRSLKRAQCYLGLLPRWSDRAKDGCDVADQATSEDELMAFLPPLLPGKELAPYSFADQPIFISVDVEWNERQRNQITEVGISTLDTLDIAHVAPGRGGKNWQPWIRSRHIRIKEYAHVVNCDFVSGCPDQFGFGKSEFVPLQYAAREVESCFKPPYSAQVPVKFMNEEASGDKPTVTIETAIKEYKLRRRNVVLVGHGLQADISYLRALGCNLCSGNTSKAQSQKSSQVSVTEPSSPLFLDTLDTATMFQALKRDVHSRGLENVLASLGILAWNLHNAGNDARYTLEAMLRMVINARAALDKGPQDFSGDYMDWALRPVANTYTALHEIAWQIEVDRRVSEAVADRGEQIRDDCKIWEIVTGWDSGHHLTSHDMDGGEPNVFIFK